MSRPDPRRHAEDHATTFRNSTTPRWPTATAARASAARARTMYGRGAESREHGVQRSRSPLAGPTLRPWPAAHLPPPWYRKRSSSSRRPASSRATSRSTSICTSTIGHLHRASGRSRAPPSRRNRIPQRCATRATKFVGTPYDDQPVFASQPQAARRLAVGGSSASGYPFRLSPVLPTGPTGAPSPYQRSDRPHAESVPTVRPQRPTATSPPCQRSRNPPPTATAPTTYGGQPSAQPVPTPPRPAAIPYAVRQAAITEPQYPPTASDIRCAVVARRRPRPLRSARHRFRLRNSTPRQHRNNTHCAPPEPAGPAAGYVPASNMARRPNTARPAGSRPIRPSRRSRRSSAIRSCFPRRRPIRSRRCTPTRPSTWTSI